MDTHSNQRNLQTYIVVFELKLFPWRDQFSKSFVFHPRNMFHRRQLRAHQSYKYYERQVIEIPSTATIIPNKCSSHFQRIYRKSGECGMVLVSHDDVSHHYLGWQQQQNTVMKYITFFTLAKCRILRCRECFTDSEQSN